MQLTKDKNCFSKKMKKHINFTEIAGAITAMCMILLFITPIIGLGERAFERWTPTDWWFEYHSIIPAEASVEAGGAVGFYSIVEYKRPVFVGSADYLVCTVGDKNIKLKTQLWPATGSEPKQVGIVNLPDGDGKQTAWYYNAEPIPLGATACRLETSVTGYTTQYRYPKFWQYTTDWFTVTPKTTVGT